MYRLSILVLSFGLGAAPLFAQPSPSSPLPRPAPSSGSGPGGLRLPEAPAAAPAAPPPAPGPVAVVSPPPRAPALREDLVNFDPATVRLAWTARHWQLQVEDRVLKDFGWREADARLALRLIQSLHLNQYGTVRSGPAGSAPALEYWLADGKAPQAGPGIGLRVLPIVRSGLRVEQAQGQWVVRDPQRILFNFGQQADQARQALAVLQKYGFTQVATVGAGAPAMMVFLANAPTGLLAPHAASSGRHLTTPHFPRQSRSPEMRAATEKEGTRLDGVAAPALQFVTNGQPGTHATHGPAEGPGWRGQPHFGPRPLGQAGVASAERVPFDWRQAQVRLADGTWKLAVGSVVLADFGPNATEANQALSALRHYHFTEKWQMGEHFTYYLASGQAPRGLLVGANAQSFKPDALTVQQVSGRYALCSGPQALVWFGERPNEARALLEVIQRNRFDRLCRIGSDGAGQGMTFLVRSR